MYGISKLCFFKRTCPVLRIWAPGDSRTRRSTRKPPTIDVVHDDAVTSSAKFSTSTSGPSPLTLAGTS